MIQKYIKKQWLILGFIWFLGSSWGIAQNSLKGIIKDNNNELLAGATINIKGTDEVTLTNVSGVFTLSTRQKLPFTIIVSYVGYQAQEIDIYEISEEPLDISLKLDNVLDEIVVIGYGEQKRSNFTGSIATIPTELRQQPVSSPDKLLQGSVAGVQVTQSSGQPGSGNTIRVRGGTSINAGSEPLYVIDGFPIYNSDLSTDAGVISGAKINPLSSFSSVDIESIQVLKDASATAIYGSRGANGVIIITTKKGRRNESNISYDAFYGVQDVIRKLPLLNAEQWGYLKNDARIDAGKPPTYTQEELDQLGEGTDWQEEAFTSALIQSHNLSLSAGSDRSNLILSGNYYKQEGVIIRTGFERYSGRLNIDHDISEKLKVGVFLTGSITNADVAPNGVVQGLLEMVPTVPVKDADGSYTIVSPFETAIGNPINSLVNNTNETKTTRFLLNGFIEYEIIEGLKAKVQFGTDIINNKQNRYVASTVFEGIPGGSASVGTLATFGWLNENTLNYFKKIASRHTLDILVGFTQQKSSTEGHISNASNFVNDNSTYNNLGAGTILQAPASSYSAWALRSFLGRINYNLDDKYFLTLTLRADGSSRFGSNNRWGTFPSVAIAWNVHNESFLKNSTRISNLKLRLSSGLTGNQEIPPYRSLSILSYYSSNFNNVLFAGFAPSSYANANLGWEKTIQHNLGVDLGLFKNRINLTLDVYYKKTNDLLLNIPLPYTSGLESAFQNYGSMENKGIELALQTNNIQGELEWNTSIVISANRNKVLSLGPGITEFIPINPANSNRPSEIVRVGEPLGNFYMYQADGVFQEGDNFALSPSQNVRPGSQKYKDLNGDDKVTQADISIVGNAQPLFIGGITNTFRYKNFDLTIFLQGSFGNKIFSNTKALLEIGSGFTGASATLLDRWTPTNTDTDVHRAIEDPSPTLSDRFVENGSYLRLKNLSLGYTLPKELASKVKLQNARIYVSLQNYITWTNYTGFDPEVSRNGQDNLYSGFDYGSYPGTKSIQTGISLTF
ncbi:MAG: TonB-dependent receptor [Microscillaceae bacterium]|nr:TonB-dependent receptor [Microscillaceae bacterium]